MEIQAIQRGGLVNGISVGGGAEATNIVRITNQSFVDRLRDSNEYAQYTQSYLSGLSGLENLFGSEGLSLSTGLAQFFAAIDEASVTPESTALRQQILINSDALAQQFNALSNQLTQQETNQAQHFGVVVDSINSQLAVIASLNKEIYSRSQTGDSVAGLQDELDLHLQELSGSMEIRVLYTEDGDAEISTNNGLPLVIRDQAAKLERDFTNGDSNSVELSVNFLGSIKKVNGGYGGELGAIESLKKGVFEPTSELLNDMAKAFADEVNGALSTGYDLMGGTPGRALFTYTTNSAARSLAIDESLSPIELAFSSDGLAGNGDVLAQISMLSLQNQTYGAVAGETFYSAYSGLLGKIGIETRQAQSESISAQVALEEAQVARDSVSAVNTDEEAANMMQFMNAYEANMKVISTANQMFQTLLSAF
ncbi:flagellar hook-associated protein FlgK [Vibrio astriarenae]|nr:flagellar hook-associated protein FlgK [Vibrio sp. C7]